MGGFLLILYVSKKKIPPALFPITERVEVMRGTPSSLIPINVATVANMDN